MCVRMILSKMKKILFYTFMCVYLCKHFLKFLIQINIFAYLRTPTTTTKKEKRESNNFRSISFQERKKKKKRYKCSLIEMTFSRSIINSGF